MKPIQKNKIKVGETYEISDPIIGRIDVSYIEIISDKGDTFEAKDLITGKISEYFKTLDFYEPELV
jgi:hypothetical protein